MRVTRKSAGLALSLGAAALIGLGAAPMPAVSAPVNGADTVRTLYDTLLTTMRYGQTLGEQGRYDRIAPVVREVFDVPSMTRLVVGPAWNTASEAQRQQLIQAFTHYISAVYADRFDNYSGERLQVTGQSPTAAGLIVQSQIVKASGEPVNINYLVRQGVAGWQIADIYLNGTISELATQRSDFASVLQAQGVNGLIVALNQKAAALGTSRAS